VTLAEDGFLPRALAARDARSHASWPAVLLGGLLSALCVGLGLRRLVELDVLLYGAALVLEFAALVALRVREPDLPRPFRVPGGLAGAVALGAPPTALLALAAWKSREEPGALGLTAIGLSAAPAAIGPAGGRRGRSRGRRHCALSPMRGAVERGPHGAGFMAGVWERGLPAHDIAPLRSCPRKEMSAAFHGWRRAEQRERLHRRLDAGAVDVSVANPDGQSEHARRELYSRRPEWT
jgi:hypothetical protein